MKLYVRALDGGDGRVATKVAFVTSDDVTAGVQCDPLQRHPRISVSR